MQCVEPLECRRLLATIVLNLGPDGTLSANGTDGDDQISVKHVVINGLLRCQITINDESDSVLEEYVTRVSINGGGGNDFIDCLPLAVNEQTTHPVILEGGAGDDYLIGSKNDDAMYGGVGDDVLIAGPGADRVFGDDGADKLLGDDGDDYLSGAAQKDTLEGGLGNDRLNGNGGNDRLFGNAGIDRLYGYDGADWLDGGSSNDRLEGGGGLDTMLGQKGNDHFFAKDSEVDQLFGGDGTDDAAINSGDVVATIEVTT